MSKGRDELGVLACKSLCLGSQKLMFSAQINLQKIIASAHNKYQWTQINLQTACKNYFWLTLSAKPLYDSQILNLKYFLSSIFRTNQSSTIGRMTTIHELKGHVDLKAI